MKAELTDTFQQLRPQLLAYLLRLLGDRALAEDIAQDTWLRAWQQADTYRGESSLKTWLYAIATNLARNELRKHRRWQPDNQDGARRIAEQSETIPAALGRMARHHPYEVTEHIAFCFACLAKTLPMEQQIALILKDILHFEMAEIARITQATLPQVKYRLHAGRKTMRSLYSHRCALISQTGACWQCAELEGFFHPQRKLPAAVLALRDNNDAATLYRMRLQLIKMTTETADSRLHDYFWALNRVAAGETDCLPEELLQ